MVLLRIILCAVLFLSLSVSAGCKKKPPPPPPPPKVTVAKPLRHALTDYLELTGNTQAINTVQLVARVAGYLESVSFHDGQIVRKGQVLFRIQQNTYRYALEQAEGQILFQRAQLEYAEKQFVRYSNLLRDNATSQENVDNWRYQRDSAQANLRAAIAARDTAKLNLEYTEVAAPFDGRIDRRLQDPGNLVGSGSNTVLAQLSQIDPIYVYFTISDSDLARLTKAADGIPGRGRDNYWPVSIGLINEDGYPHRGRVDFASITFTPATGTLLMRGIFLNPDNSILPGLYAKVRVPLEKTSALFVPDTAVSNDQQGWYVMIVNDKNIVERRNIKTAPRTDGFQPVTEGLNGNEWVVTKGLLRVQPGGHVTPLRTELPAPDLESRGEKVTR